MRQDEHDQPRIPTPGPGQGGGDGEGFPGVRRTGVQHATDDPVHLRYPGPDVGKDAVGVGQRAVGLEYPGLELRGEHATLRQSEAAGGWVRAVGEVDQQRCPPVAGLPGDV